MRYQGKITIWKDDRGYGFITPSGGGRPVFVHISAFKKRQRRPAYNERVTYDLHNDPKKGFRAENVLFFEAFRPSMRMEGRGILKPFVVAILVVSIGIYAWQHLPSNDLKALLPAESTFEVKEAPKFQCQGKRRCSEMISCEEAIFYLENCPGVEIDGDGDGIPCEDQFCGH